MSDGNNMASWLKEQIDAVCVEPVYKTRKVKEDSVDQEGNKVVVHKEVQVELKKKKFNFDRFLGLLEANGIPVTEYRDWMETKNGPGRVRMTGGNRLRGIAVNSGELVLLDGTKAQVPEEFLKKEEPKAEEPATEPAE